MSLVKSGFQPGHPRYGGRPKGGKNRRLSLVRQYAMAKEGIKAERMQQLAAIKLKGIADMVEALVGAVTTAPLYDVSHEVILIQPGVKLTEGLLASISTALLIHIEVDQETIDKVIAIYAKANKAYKELEAQKLLIQDPCQASWRPFDR